MIGCEYYEIIENALSHHVLAVREGGYDDLGYAGCVLVVVDPVVVLSGVLWFSRLLDLIGLGRDIEFRILLLYSL
jgi:hypothetical protein